MSRSTLAVALSLLFAVAASASNDLSERSNVTLVFVREQGRCYNRAPL
jgi:hypothetical protein